jgi:excisionase family DNA binding protein
LTPQAAAERLGVSSDWVRILADRGVIAAERCPLGRLIDAADLERSAREHEARTQARPDPPPAA